MKDIIVYLVVLVFIVALGFAGWYAKRYINNWLYYNHATQNVVCEMVKPEYLVEQACE